MEGAKASPFAPASEIPLHRNAPLAPSQELAYRNKCIQLKRRLTEIEANNDTARRRIALEKERVAKQRLLRSILLHKLKEMMETPASRKLSVEQLRSVGILTDGDGLDMAALEGLIPGEFARSRPIGEALLDDSSEESIDEDEPEPEQKPERRRRTNNNYRESIMTTDTPRSLGPGIYQTALPSLAPANSFSTNALRDPAMLTSTFRVGSTPIVAGTPPQNQPYMQQPPHQHEPQHLPHSSPTTHIPGAPYPQAHIQTPVHGPIPAINGSALPPFPKPVRPDPPYEQFVKHMRPQLEADNYPAEEIEDRIKQEWDNLVPENRGAWDQRYEDLMLEYEHEMDQWRRRNRQHG